MVPPMTRHLGRSPRISLVAVLFLGASLMGHGHVALGQDVTECRDWAQPGVSDPRFKVWACKGADPAAADQAIVDVAALVEEIWGPMTQPVPTGMGPPMPDAIGTTAPFELGGDGRIDFYVLMPGEGVFRGGRLRRIVGGSAAAAGVSLLPESARAANPNAASGYVLVDRSRIGEAVAIRQDLIHEFFHVLEYAHNGYAPFGPPDHWFVEASATWAETYYLRDDSDKPHAWFDTFQTFSTGLEAPDPTTSTPPTSGPSSWSRRWVATRSWGPGRRWTGSDRGPTATR